MERESSRNAWIVMVLALTTIHAGLLFGHQPIGSDPDLMYRPYKQELAKALREGTLPFWSDRFGLGIPLVADSQVAAFYPPNWIAYRAFDVDQAYRLLMFASYLALASSTFVYARSLDIKPWGAALSGLSFSLCGFQANHAVHEWAVNAVPFLPLNLWLTDRLLKTGARGFAAALALTIGLQLSIGHFQVQWMTLAMILLLAAVRRRLDNLPSRRLVWVLIAMVWGGAAASLSLLASIEMLRFTQFRRPTADLETFPLHPLQVIQSAFPTLFNGFRDGFVDRFWLESNTTGLESSLYFGTIPLVLFGIGIVIPPKDRIINAWKGIAAVTLVLASLPILAPGLFRMLATLPGFGTFRCPARYTLITSLGASLIAGSALDRGVSRGDVRRGTRIVGLFVIMAAGWAAWWFSRSDSASRLMDGFAEKAVAVSILTWLMAAISLIGWRSRQLGPWGPLLVTALELGLLFYQAGTQWGWPTRSIAESPVFQRLGRESHVGLVAGPLFDLAVVGEFRAASAYTGITAPPPNPWLFPASERSTFQDERYRRLYRRFGVSHGIWPGLDVPADDSESLYEGPDRWLDHVVHQDHAHSTWRLARYPDPFPDARLAKIEALFPLEGKRSISNSSSAKLLNDFASLDFDEPRLMALTDAEPSTDTVFYEPNDRPPGKPDAKQARLKAWDGRSAVVETDGTCDLVVNRTFYPGWVASSEGENEVELPIHRADGGIQAVRLHGAGTHRLTFRYEPTWLPAGLALTAAAVGAAVLVLSGGFKAS